MRAEVLYGVGREPLVLTVVQGDDEGAVHVAHDVAFGASVAAGTCVDGGNDERKEYYKRVVWFHFHNYGVFVVAEAGDLRHEDCCCKIMKICLIFVLYDVKISCQAQCQINVRQFLRIVT